MNFPATILEVWDVEYENGFKQTKYVCDNYSYQWCRYVQSQISNLKDISRKKRTSLQNYRLTNFNEMLTTAFRGIDIHYHLYPESCDWFKEGRIPPRFNGDKEHPIKCKKIYDK